MNSAWESHHMVRQDAGPAILQVDGFFAVYFCKSFSGLEYSLHVLCVVYFEVSIVVQHANNPWLHLKNLLNIIGVRLM